jgi:hypothetical protein
MELDPKQHLLDATCQNMSKFSFSAHTRNKFNYLSNDNKFKYTNTNQIKQKLVLEQATRSQRMLFLCYTGRHDYKSATKLSLIYFSNINQFHDHDPSDQSFLIHT